MLATIYEFFNFSLFPFKTGKRRADDVLEIEPSSKVTRINEFSSRTYGMASDEKENEQNRNTDDEVRVVEEVKPQWVSPRKTIRRTTGTICTSTPVNNQRSSSDNPFWRPSPRVQVMMERVRNNQDASTSRTDLDVQYVRQPKKDDDDVRILRTVRTPDKRGHTNKCKSFLSSFRHSTFASKSNFRKAQHANREGELYRKLLAQYFQPSQRQIVSPCTIARVKPKTADIAPAHESPFKVPIVDLTKDVRINRDAERDRPSTSSTRAAAAADDIIVLEEFKSPRKGQSSPRVSSLEHYLSLNPTFAEKTNIDKIIETHKTNKAEKERLAKVEETKLAILSPHNACAINDALEERMRDYMKITEPPILDIEEEEEPLYFLPTLTEEQESQVTAALKPNPPREVLVDKFGLSVTRHDMTSLKGTNWLNDEVINFYMNLIIERGKAEVMPTVYAFNTFFYPKLLSGGHAGLKRWTRRIDIFSHDMVFVPIHLGVHWCMAMIDFRIKQIRYYDSMGSPNDKCLDALFAYLEDESLDKKKKKFDSTGWEMVNADDVPEQLNGSDCGVFACTIAEHLARDQSLLFTQDDMPLLRRKMVYEILTAQLIT